MKTLNRKAYITLALFLFMVAAVAFLQMMAIYQQSQYMLTESVDLYHQEAVEASGVGQVLKESILAFEEIAPAVTSSTTLGQEFTNRFNTLETGSSVSFGYGAAQIPAGVYPLAFQTSVDAGWTWPTTPFAMSPSGSLPVTLNSFFPSTARPTVSDAHVPNAAGYVAASLTALNGVKQTVLQQLMLGKMAELTATSGPLALPAFTRYSNTTVPNVNYAATARIFSVPITNYSYVMYGLPSGGGGAIAIPANPGLDGSSGGNLPRFTPLAAALPFASADIKPLIVSSDDPNPVLHGPSVPSVTGDGTAFGDLWSTSTPEVLPYRYREAVSADWNLYDYIFQAGTKGYMNALETAAQNGGSSGACFFDFAIGALPPGMSAFPAGFSYVPGTQTLTITLANLPVPQTNGSGQVYTDNLHPAAVYVISDSQGIGHVNIVGGGATGVPIVIAIVNQLGVGAATVVNFTAANSTPVMLYMQRCAVTSNVGFTGGVMLDPYCTVAGTCNITGHLSNFYQTQMGTWTVTPAAATEALLSDVAPRFIVVSTSVTRQ